STDPAAMESCDITQTGATNYALVDQTIDTNAAPVDTTGTQTQANKQFAHVKQMGFQNQSDISQDINQSLNTSVATSITQKQDANQQVWLCQEGIPSSPTPPPTIACEQEPNDGTNSSKVMQSRFGAAQASGASITQLQYTNYTPIFGNS